MNIQATTLGNRNAFTLIELLIVIVVIMVLVGILMPTLYGTKTNAKDRQALAEMKALETAIINYKFANREWPYIGAHNQDVLCSNSNHEVVSKLLDEEPPLIDESDFRMDKNKNVLDPWGNVYVIKLDTDYNGYWKNTTNEFRAGVSVERQ
jgi:type II secretory pathway pseudopilin PulG